MSIKIQIYPDRCKTNIGRFGRELILDDSLDTSNASADYVDGALTPRAPVAEQAKPRRIAVTASKAKKLIAT